MTKLEATLEAILFAVGDAVPVARLAAAADAEPAQVAYALHTLAAHYDQSGSGIQLVHMEDKVQLCTRPAYAAAVRRATESRRPPALSASALEVLTVVAYRQPVTRAYIEQLRGVDSSGTVASLLDKGLIEACGHLDVHRMILSQSMAQLQIKGLLRSRCPAVSSCRLRSSSA